MTYAARTALIAGTTRGAPLRAQPEPSADKSRARPPHVALLGMRAEASSGSTEPPSPTGKCTSVSREQLLAEVVRKDYLVDTLLHGPDGELDAHERLLEAMPVRKGKWTPQEEAYTARMIRDFRLGLLGVAEGTTLRCYLAKALRCDPMRITKKFAGREAIGKQVYRRRRPPPNELPDLPDKFVTVKMQRDKLRHAFLVRVRSQHVASREPRNKDRRWSGCGPRSRKPSPKPSPSPALESTTVGLAEGANNALSVRGAKPSGGARSAAARRRMEALQLQAKARQHPGALRLPRGGVDGASTSPTSGGSPGHSGRVMHYATEHPGYATRPAAGGSSGSSNDSQDSGAGAAPEAVPRPQSGGGLYAAPNTASPPFGPSSLTHAVPAAMGVSAAGCSPRSEAAATSSSDVRLDVDGQWRTGGPGYHTPRKRASPCANSQGRPLHSPPSAGPFIASPGIIGGKKRRRLSPARRSPAGILGHRSPGSARVVADRLVIRDDHSEQHHEGAVLLTQFFQSVNSPVP